MQMPMYDQLIIGGLGSCDEFGASLAYRETPPPKKKSIKETLPFSNVSYDFSAINGETYWEERELIYTFEIIVDTPQELEEQKAAFANWVMNIANAEIYDPYIEGYHFLGTFESMEYEDTDDVEKCTISVTFLAYPYKISDHVKNYSLDVGAGASSSLAVVNNSSHRVQMVVATNGAITLTLGDTSYNIPAGTITDADLMFLPGNNTITVKNSGTASVAVSVSFWEEVF